MQISPQRRVLVLPLTLLAFATTAATSAAQVTRVEVATVGVRPAPEVLYDHVAHDIIIDFAGQFTGSLLVVKLEAGSIYQHPLVDGVGPPGPSVIALDPWARFDTYITASPLAGSIDPIFPPTPQPIFPVCVTFPCPTPQLKFDTEGISIGWNPPAEIQIRDQSGFHVARITLSDDARGSIRYLGFAAGVDPSPALVAYSPIASGEVQRKLFVAGPAGDYNASGQVEQADLDLVLLHWGVEIVDPAGLGWYNDLPSGPVDQEELDKILLAWGKSTSFAGSPSAVPEPSTWVLLIVACIAVVGAVRRAGLTWSYESYTSCDCLYSLP